MAIVFKVFQCHILLLTLLLVVAVLGNEIALTQFPVYTQMTFTAAYCASSASSTYRISYGCDYASPAACLCTNALSSSKIVYAIGSCIGNTDRSIVASATSLWASYCLTNAGVSAQDETLLQDIPIYTQVTNMVRFCATQATASFITSFGCNDYTKAPCLCGNSASSLMVRNSIQSCVGTYYGEDQEASATMLWSSFCGLNLQQPAVRSVGAPIAVSGKLLEVD